MNTLAYDPLDDYVIEEETYGLKDDQDAIFQLYECLFDKNLKHSDPYVYQALRFLLWNKGMHSVYEEMVAIDKQLDEIYEGEERWTH